MVGRPLSQPHLENEMIVADWTAALTGNGELVNQWIDSTPNGQTYGSPGHVPSDHVAVFEYQRATVKLHGDGRLEREAHQPAHRMGLWTAA
jgi:hypothetical protein